MYKKRNHGVADAEVLTTPRTGRDNYQATLVSSRTLLFGALPGIVLRVRRQQKYKRGRRCDNEK